MAGLTLTSMVWGHELMQPLEKVIYGPIKSKHLFKRVHNRMTLEAGAWCGGLLTGQTV